jgi:hypothetical protein
MKKVHEIFKTFLYAKLYLSNFGVYKYDVRILDCITLAVATFRVVSSTNK